MVLEEQRLLHEDLERLEQAIANRVVDEPKHIRDRLNRDHQIGNFLGRIQSQSSRLLALYQDSDGARAQEIQVISTGDPFEEFYRQLNDIKDFHKRYPNEPVENLERAYKRRAIGDAEPIAIEVDTMFSGEESHGRFLDLTSLHEQYLNLPGVKGARRMTYLQYLDAFDIFAPGASPFKKADKMTDAYFQYLGSLKDYLVNYIRKIRPLEDLEQLFFTIETDFEQAWAKDELQGWTLNDASTDQKSKSEETDGHEIWCDACKKTFKNPNVYSHHLTQKKHLRAVESKKSQESAAAGTANGASSPLQRVKEKAVAEREFAIQRLTAAMQTERGDTRVNVERKQGMTDRERQQELEALLAEDEVVPGMPNADDSGSDDEEKVYNPLKLPLAWDGKPIPFWLYKLHGLGVEFPCEICGNFVYMGRRAFDKHFNEGRHVLGLKCLGITNTTLFREITKIDDALKLWDKITRDKKKDKAAVENVVQMEDGDGNVMPEKVYNDLRKQGLL